MRTACSSIVIVWFCCTQVLHRRAGRLPTTWLVAGRVHLAICPLAVLSCSTPMQRWDAWSFPPRHPGRVRGGCVIGPAPRPRSLLSAACRADEAGTSAPPEALGLVHNECAPPPFAQAGPRGPVPRRTAPWTRGSRFVRGARLARPCPVAHVAAASAARTSSSMPCITSTTRPTLSRNALTDTRSMRLVDAA